MNETYERSGMTLFKEVDGKLVVVANFEHGMDDDMQQLLDNKADRLLEALKKLDRAHKKGFINLKNFRNVPTEAIRKAKELT